LHFQPGGFNHANTKAANSPSPQTTPLNGLQVAYYYFNYLTAWWLVVLPARIRSHLVVCEASFDELLVNEKQMGANGIAAFVRFLRKILPRADRTFILLTPAWVSLQRHPGSAIEEWERQHRILLQLADDTRRYSTISAEESPEELARDIWREVVKGMAAREARRG
jgi:thymidylate kinase